MANEQYITKEGLSEDQIQAIKTCDFEIINIDRFLESIKLKKQNIKQRFYKSSIGQKFDFNEVNTDPIDPKTPTKERRNIQKRKSRYKAYLLKSDKLLHESISNQDEQGKKVSKYELLLADKRTLIMEYFGRLYTIPEVLTIVRGEWGMRDITQNILTDFYNQYFSEIEKLQKNYKDKFEHLRLTIKTSRLEELTWMYNRLKSKYEKNNNRDDHKVMLATLESIRKEVEGDRITIDKRLDLTIRQDITIQVRNELLKDLPLREIIIGRLAAKTGIAPRDIINDMSSSYYAKMNSLVNNVTDIDFEEIEFPSLLSYDFEAIEKVNKDNELKDKDNKEKKTKEDAVKALSNQNNALKEALLKKVNDTIIDVKQQRDDLKRMLGN